jgi:hypothetical protein
MSGLGPSITVLAGARVGERRIAADAADPPDPSSSPSSATLRATSALLRAPALRDEVAVGLTTLEQQNRLEVALLKRV